MTSKYSLKATTQFPFCIKKVLKTAVRLKLFIHNFVAQFTHHCLANVDSNNFNFKHMNTK